MNASREEKIASILGNSEVIKDEYRLYCVRNELNNSLTVTKEDFARQYLLASNTEYINWSDFDMYLIVAALHADKE